MHRRRQNRASDRTPDLIEPQICAGGFSNVFRRKLDAKIVDKPQQLSSASPDSTGSFNGAHPARLITMLVKKLLVGHTRSISGPILRRRDFWLTAPSILCEKICCLWEIKVLCTSPCGIPRLLPTSFYTRPPPRQSFADRTKIGGK